MASENLIDRSAIRTEVSQES